MGEWKAGARLACLSRCNRNYLYAYPSATLVYAGAVLLHTGLGVLVSLALVGILFRESQERLLARCG